MKRNNMKLPEEAKIMKEFNVSVAITDDFMSRLKKGEYHKFVNPRTGKEVLKCNKCEKNVFPTENESRCNLCGGEGERIKAKELWQKIIDCAWECADPGLIFIDKINNSNSNPLREHYKIESTNPCGEVPLLPNESCNLGSINISKFVNEKEDDIDWDKLTGMILMNHGVFSFGNNAKQSYDRMINIVTKAEQYLKKAKVWRNYKKSTSKANLLTLAKIRKKASEMTGKACLALLNDSTEAVGFSKMKAAKNLSLKGTLTPDHVIRTKPFAWVIKDNLDRSAKEFENLYTCLLYTSPSPRDRG